MKKKILLGLVILVCGLLVFAGCSSSTDKTTTDTSKTDSTTGETLEERFEGYGDDLRNELDMISAKAETATGAEAATLKDSADDIANRADKMEAYLEDQVDKGNLTEDAKDSLEKTLDSIKEDAETASKDLENKADGAAASAEYELSYIDSKDGVDTVINSVKKGVDSLTETLKDSGDKLDTYTKDTIESTEKYLDALGTRIDKLASDNTITEDAKKDYDNTISTLKADLAKMDTSMTTED